MSGATFVVPAGTATGGMLANTGYPVHRMTEIGVSRPVNLPVMPATADVCPYLLAADGGWRASTPAREHRCTAVSPAAILAPEKQRRLCLVAEHRGCSTYAAASGVGGVGDEPLAHDRSRAGRPFARTAPLVLDHGGFAMSMPALGSERSLGQSGLVALMAVAFGAIIIARLSGGGPALTPAQVAGAASGTPSPSSAATARATTIPAATEEAAPGRTLVPTEVEPTPTPAAEATPKATAEATPKATAEATPSPAAAAKTYTVRSGDTLAGIAGEFGTTWQVLAQLNRLDDPTALQVGQVLELP